MIELLPEDISVQLGVVESVDVDGVDGWNSEHTEVPELRIPLEVESKERVYFSDVGDWEVELAYDIVGQLDDEDWEEALLYSVDVQLIPHIGQQYDVFVSLGDSQYLQIVDALDTEVLNHLY